MTLGDRARRPHRPEAERLAAAGARLAVSVGSTEQHGPLLPLSTDTDVAVALAVRLAARREDVVVALPVWLPCRRMGTMLGCSPGDAQGPATDAHAGRGETAIQLALDPGRVRDLAVPGNQPPIAELMPVVTAGVRAVSRNGVRGDRAGGWAAEGTVLLEALTADLLAAIAQWPGEGPG
jgi:creatinine amidohydrolase